MMTLASKRLRAVSYMYLRALAVADLLCMIFVLVFVSGEIVQRAGIPLNHSPIYGFYQAHLMLSLINWALATVSACFRIAVLVKQVKQACKAGMKREEQPHLKLPHFIHKPDQPPD
ncbi:unnamed protein product [Gongylonema pulchrum]|uniref:G_PROTEIN_RECEP_F1_2 domain-containing protein n=1 Tax=Gongylonema pulchrum TaxID=637853 RepID=A0A3P6QQ68_9BILA|nr:unnamed protein product [Gongylonema pulchrum]